MGHQLQAHPCLGAVSRLSMFLLPLSMKEDIPWKCQHLVVGTGDYGAMPMVEERLVAAGNTH